MSRAACRLCGDLLHRVADTSADVWAWADEDGSQSGLDADLRRLPGGDPYTRLSVLASAMDAAMKAAGGPRGRKASLTSLYWATAREYSALKVRADSGTHHVHQVCASDLAPYAGEVPRCCGWPGWLRPSGWQCRQLSGTSTGMIRYEQPLPGRLLG